MANFLLGCISEPKAVDLPSVNSPCWARAEAEEESTAHPFMAVLYLVTQRWPGLQTDTQV